GGVGVGLHEDLSGARLGGAVEVHGVDGVVGGQRHDAGNAGVDRGVGHVLGAQHVRAHGLEGVVLARRHLLHGGGVNDHVGALRRPSHTTAVADITDEEAKALVAVASEHL